MQPKRHKSLLGTARLAWVVGYEGLYAVTDGGRLFSYVKNWNTPSGARPMQLKLHKQGYREIGLTKNGQQTYHLVHRLVLEAFDRPGRDGEVCCHANGDPSDNRIENLRWDSQSANWHDAKAHGTASVGMRQGNALLNPEKVTKIRQLYSTGQYSHAQLGEHFGVSGATVSAVARGRSWKHIGGPINGRDYEVRAGNWSNKLRRGPE